MTSETPEADWQEQQTVAFEVTTDEIVIEPSTAEANETDRIEQAIPIPLEDDDTPPAR